MTSKKKKSTKTTRAAQPRTTTDRREVARVRLLRDPAFAAWLAAEAHENNFSSRRGLGVSRGLLYYYTNNPFAHGQKTGTPYDATRDGLRNMELALLRTWLAEQKVEVLAEASYPPPGGDDAGFTKVLLLNAPESAEGAVRAELREILRKVYATLDAVAAQQAENQPST